MEDKKPWDISVHMCTYSACFVLAYITMNTFHVDKIGLWKNKLILFFHNTKLK